MAIPFGTLVLDDSVIIGNTGVSAGGAEVANLSMSGSAVVDNVATGVGGVHAIVATVERSTLAGNIGGATGGLFVDVGRFGVPGHPSASHLRGSTVAGNVSTAAGPDELRLWGKTPEYFDPFVNKLHISSSVVGEPGGSASCAVVAHGSFISGGWNVGSDGSCGLTAPSDLVGVDPVLGPLGDHGGPSPTRVPGVGSPLVDRIPVGDPACVGLDQRGVARPIGVGCDVGAVEVSGVSVGAAVVDEPVAGWVVVRVPLTLDAPSPTDVFVTVASVDGSAVAGADFKGFTRTVRIPAGKAVREVPVKVFADGVVEGDESFGLEVVSVSGGVWVRDGSGSVTVRDPAGSGFTVGDVSVVEPGVKGAVSVRVALDVPAVAPVSVRVRLVSDSGTVGADVRALERVVVIPAGGQSKRVALQVWPDELAEGVEDVRIVLDQPVGAPLARAEGTLRIVDPT